MYMYKMHVDIHVHVQVHVNKGNNSAACHVPPVALPGGRGCSLREIRYVGMQ